MVENRVRVVDLALGVDGLGIGVDRQPRRTAREAALCAVVPLHRGTAVIAGVHAQDIVNAVLVQAAAAQDVVMVDALDVAVLVQRGKTGVGHAQFLALIDVRRAAQAMDDRAQHLGRLLPVFALVAKARHDARLVVVAPENSVPCVVFGHAGLPREQDILEFLEVEGDEYPLLIAHKVYLEVMEREGHGQLTGVRTCVAVAIFHARARHLAHGHDLGIGAEGGLVELVQVLMYPRAVGVESAAIALVVALIRALADEVDHVEAEALDALAHPEADDFLHFMSNVRVFPVEVSLSGVEQVQVPLALFRDVCPCAAAELALPVIGRGVRVAVLPDVVIFVLGVACECLLEPLVFGRGVVKHHVQHHADIARLGLAAQRLKVLHRAESGVNIAVIGHVVAVIALGRDEKRGHPDIVDAQRFEVIQLGGHAAQIAQSVAVRVTERLGINLIDNAFAEIVHGNFAS